MSNSELEDLFAQQLDALRLTGYLREYQAVKGVSSAGTSAGSKRSFLPKLMAGLIQKVRIRLARG